MTIQVEYHDEHACVFITEELTTPTAIDVYKTLGDLRGYWHYETIVLEINSPGGELSALRQIAHDLQICRAEGVCVHTRGLIQVGSAAALLLALGNIGFRTVHPHTELLFHRTRFLTKADEVLTARAAVLAAEQLKRRDDEVLRALMSHLEEGFGGVVALGQEGLARLERWAAGDTPIAPTASLHGVNPTPNLVLDDALRAQLGRAYRAMVEDQSTDQYLAVLALAFEEDRLLSLTHAWAMVLIDRTSQVLADIH
jgi:hypothetical protein